MYIYIYAYTCVCVCVHIYIYTYVYMRVCVYTCLYVLLSFLKFACLLLAQILYMKILELTPQQTCIVICKKCRWGDTSGFRWVHMGMVCQ